MFASLSLNDSGSGVEDVVLYALIVAEDSGSGTESFDLEAFISAIDAAGGTDIATAWRSDISQIVSVSFVLKKRKVLFELIEKDSGGMELIQKDSKFKIVEKLF